MSYAPKLPFMNSPLAPILCTVAVLCLALAAPPPAEAGPLRSIGASLKKLNPFRKSEPKPAEPAPPAAKPKPKPTVAKTAKPAPAKKKKTSAATTKKSSVAPVAATGAAVAGTTDADETKSNAKGTEPPTASETPTADGSAPPSADSAPVTPAEIPFGTPVMGRKGLVRSPYAEDQGMVDVTDLPAGAKVKCPFTGKVFRVP